MFLKYRLIVYTILTVQNQIFNENTYFKSTFLYIIFVELLCSYDFFGMEYRLNIFI